MIQGTQTRDFEKYHLNWRISYQYNLALNAIQYQGYFQHPLHRGTDRWDWNLYPDPDTVKGIRDGSIDPAEYAFREDNLDQFMTQVLESIIDYAFLCMALDKNPYWLNNPWIEKGSAEKHKAHRDEEPEDY